MLPLLPIEVWEICIDQLVSGYTSPKGSSYSDNIDLRRDLWSCALVCRAWRIHAQVHLFAFLRISGKGLAQYEALVLKRPALCALAKQFKFFNSYVGDSGDGRTDKTTGTASHAVRIAHKLPNTYYLVLDNINLAVEHTHFPRYLAALSTITRLDLYTRTPTKLFHLARSLVGMRNLSVILLDIPIIIPSTPAPLPTSYYAPKSSLTTLLLIIRPGGNLLLEWFVNAQPFTASLQALGVKLAEHIPEREIVPVVRNLQSLLYRWADHLKRWHFYAKTAVDNLPSLCIPPGQRTSELLFTLIYAILSSNSVPLGSNKSLSMLEFRLSKTWFKHILEQLKSITSKQINEIVCLYWLDKEERPCEDLWRELDEILASEIFKPLIRLEVGCAYTNFRGIDIEWHHIASFRSELQDLMPRAFKKGVITL